MASALARANHQVVVIDLGFLHVSGHSHSVPIACCFVHVGRHLYIVDILHGARIARHSRVTVTIGEFALPHAVLFGPWRLLLTLRL